MQQTENLKLNLIETGDLLSPAPINENAEKIEAALTSGLAAVRAEAAAGDAALDARVQVLELHKFTTGYYMGNGSKVNDSQFIELSFTPVAVIMYPGTASNGLSIAGVSNNLIEIVSGGIKVYHRISPTSNNGTANQSGIRYCYIAFC